MTKIRQRAFANRIEEYILNPASFSQRRFDSSLYSLVKNQNISVSSGEAPLASTMHGLCFSEYIELVMILLNHAYCHLGDATPPKVFARAMAAAMQKFADPLEDESPACYPGPYFLLHGISKKNLAACVAQFESNGRIIHETLAARKSFLDRYGTTAVVGPGIKMLMEEGSAEDFFGICAYITKEDEQHPHGTDPSYIAKVSFFVDCQHKTIIIITVQGQRVYSAQKERSRDFARLAAKLKMDPRIYVLKKVAAIAKEAGYQRLRLVRPSHHPMYLDEHVGFTARYEPLVRLAGFCQENDCYLEGSL